MASATSGRSRKPCRTEGPYSSRLNPSRLPQIAETQSSITACGSVDAGWVALAWECAMRVLFVEDNVTLIKTVKRLVEREYEILVAANCADAIRLLDRRPDLVVVDIILPDCD